MKPFDLKLALEGKPVITRGGRYLKKTYCFYDIDKDNKRIMYIIDGYPVFVYVDGRFSLSSESCYDLFMESEKVTKWQNIFKNSLGEYYASMDLFDTEPEAKEKATPKVISTISITFEI